MGKLVLTKDPSHKGYYQDADGNLYVFRFGGRPIKVDEYREDKPNENYNNNKVEVEKEVVVDGTEKAQKEYKIGGTEGDVYEYAEKQGITYDQAETLLNINGDDYTEERKTQKESDTNHFAGWELYSDDPNRFGDKLRNYNEKMNPKTYTDKLLESERATLNYQKAKAEYDKAWEKYRDVNFNDKDYEKYKSLKDEAQEKYNVARKEAMNKFNETIPYQEMFKTGTEIAGVNTKFTEPIMDEKGYVKYQSEDIRSQCGAFGKVLRECRLTQFNSSISFDEKTNEPFYWGSMDLSYQHNEGGSNGMRIMDYTYSTRNGWEMKDTKGNIYHNGRELKSASELAEYFEGKGYTKETAMNRANELIANRKN